MQKFATTAAIAAVLDIPAGRVQLIAADRDDATVDIRPVNAAKSADVKAAEQVTVEFADGVLRITAAPAKNKILGDSGSVEVTVQLPAGSRVEAKSAAAELRGVGRLGDVVFESAQGPAVMQTRDALFRVAAECAVDLAEDGVVYAEVRYAPEQHLEAGLTLEQVVEAVNEGFREGERQARANGHRIRVGALLTAMRHAA
ncbi:hypothetical protein ACWCQ0_50355, partial [Streptomyces massasporeus]